MSDLVEQDIKEQMDNQAQLISIHKEIEHYTMNEIRVENLFFHGGFKCFIIKYSPSDFGKKSGMVEYRYGLISIPNNHKIRGLNGFPFNINKVTIRVNFFGNLIFVDFENKGKKILNPGKFYFPSSNEQFIGISYNKESLNFVEEKVCILVDQINKNL